MNLDDLSPWLVRGLYLFGFALMLTAAIDLGTTVWPLRPAEITWRYGFLGLSAGYLQTPTLGLIIVMGTALVDRSPGVLRFASLVSLLAALILLGVMGIFALDVLQVRELRPEELRSQVLVGGFFQEVKYFVAMLVFAALGYGGLKTAAPLAAAMAGRAREPGIVSTGGGAAPRRAAGTTFKAPPAPVDAVSEEESVADEAASEGGGVDGDEDEGSESREG